MNSCSRASECCQKSSLIRALPLPTKRRISAEMGSNDGKVVKIPLNKGFTLREIVWPKLTRNSAYFARGVKLVNPLPSSTVATSPSVMGKQNNCVYFGDHWEAIYMQFGRKLRLAMTIGAVASSLSLGLIAPTISGAAAPSGTITFAEGPGANPNYIFPYVGCQFFSVDTSTSFRN